MTINKNAVATIFATLLLTIGVTGCGFSVGTSSGNEDYKDLFPDRAAKLDKNYKTSDMGYKFTVGDGEMMVYVDTSDGHSFEVINNPAGFKIKDKDGNDALYAVCMERDQYEDYTSYCTEVKTINGRDFLYTMNGDGSEDCFSYMADCGMDYGLVLEVHDGNTENFELVSFRGKALEGASSDVYFYQGTWEGAVPEDMPGDDEYVTDEQIDDDTTSGDDTSVYIDSKKKESMDSLQNDYSKVNWGVEYDFGEDLDGIVVSVTPSVLYDDNILVVAITNLYTDDICFSANAQAKDENDNIVGESFIYNICIGSGNTAINLINCEDKNPDGRIHWENVEVTEAISPYVMWEVDYGLSGKPSDGYVTVDYSLYAEDKEPMVGDMVYFLLLDADGFVTAVGSDYVSEVEAGATYESSFSVYGDEGWLASTEDMAVFANPYHQ